MSTRHPIFAGNWKMHLTADEVERYAREVCKASLPDAAHCLLFPSFPYLNLLATALQNSSAEVGAQDLHEEDEGAHTGDVSPQQLVDCGCLWVLCGHSERRRDHGEEDALVAAKVRAAWRAGLLPILCLGESLAEREAGTTFDVLARQLESLLDSSARRPSGQEGDLTVAYEPVWAIGTGKTATPEIAQEAHAFLRDRLAHHLGEEAAATVPILYGGSVKPENCGQLYSEADIDGFLIGGASLDPARFLDIIDRCS